VNLIVIAKAPRAGRVKTRLCPPCTPHQAAGLAEAALSDTLAAVSGTPARRRVLALEGAPGPWLPRGFDVVGQRGQGLGERLAAAIADAGAPALVVGMDTPQLAPALLSAAASGLGAHDAVLGPALDGGYWAIGLRRADPAAFAGVPMSTPDTFAAQARRLRELRLRTAILDPLRDVDTFDDALAVGRAAPLTRFAARLRALGLDAMAA
jgi:rSAM/selenodomain-associated transferase 1